MLLEYAVECRVPAPEAFVAACDCLRELLVEANKITNLTRIVEPEDFAVKHVADSLSIGRFFPEITTDRLKIADIGCGAGFPALILALAYPQLKICAIDSIGKKTRFVEHAAAELKLTNLEVVTGRSRELNHRGEFKHRFDLVTARAVAHSLVIYNDAKDFTNRPGRFILYKTPDQLAEELPELRKATTRNWQTTEVFTLPGSDAPRQFLFF